MYNVFLYMFHGYKNCIIIFTIIFPLRILFYYYFFLLRCILFCELEYYCIYIYIRKIYFILLDIGYEMTHSRVAPSFKRKFRAMSPRVPVARDLWVAGAWTIAVSPWDPVGGGSEEGSGERGMSVTGPLLSTTTTRCHACAPRPPREGIVRMEISLLLLHCSSFSLLVL